MQRIQYLSMAYNRFTSVLNFLYEITIVLLLTLSISPLDVPNPKVFFCYLAVYLVMDTVKVAVLNTGPSQGLHKSEAGATMLETVMRWKAIRGFVFAAFHIGSVKFNVTAKSHDGSSVASGESNMSLKSDDDTTFPDRPLPVAVADSGISAAPEQPSVPPRAVNFTGSTKFLTFPVDAAAQQQQLDAALSIDDGAASSGRISIGASSRRSTTLGSRRSTTLVGGSGRVADKTVVEKLREFRSSMRQVWFSALCAAVLIFAMVWAVLNPPSTETRTGDVDGARTLTILGFGFASGSLMWHLAVVLLAFLPYTSGWMMSDFVHGHCDQYARLPSGRKYVPLSWVSIVTVFRSLLLFGFVAWLGYETWTEYADVPLSF